MFKTLLVSEKNPTIFKSNSIQFFLHQTAALNSLIILLLIINFSNASSLIKAEIVFNENNSNNNGSLDKLLSKTSIAISEKLGNKLINRNDKSFFEDTVNLNNKANEVVETKDETNKYDKETYYIVKALPINRKLTNNHKSKFNSIKHKKIFKVDKNLQRLEKKSWKIPIKSLALYSENTKDSQAPQKMMDELTDLFDSFKDT